MATCKTCKKKGFKPVTPNSIGGKLLSMIEELTVDEKILECPYCGSTNITAEE